MSIPASLRFRPLANWRNGPKQTASTVETVLRASRIRAAVRSSLGRKLYVFATIEYRWDESARGSTEADTRPDGTMQVVGEPSDTASDGTIEIHLVHPIEGCMRKMSKAPPQE